MGLQEIGVQLDSKTGYIVGGHKDFEMTSVPHIYAIGDVLKVWNTFLGEESVK